jgi:GT2 family glycosyltransferase
VGTTKHSNFDRFHKYLGSNERGQYFYTTLWADGVMLWSRAILDQVGRFNETYFGDKESQEYCYRVHDLGYNNIYFTPDPDTLYENQQVDFSYKTKYDVQEFLAIKNETVDRFRDKWCPWEEMQYYRFK